MREEVAVCSQCFAPVEPATDYCAGCGTSVGQFTEYVPFVNIPWQATGMDRMRRQGWPWNGTVFGRVVGIAVANFIGPFVLVWRQFRRSGRRADEES